MCERVIRTIRRECLDWLIPMSEGHLRATLREWVRLLARVEHHLIAMDRDAIRTPRVFAHRTLTFSQVPQGTRTFDCIVFVRRISDSSG